MHASNWKKKPLEVLKRIKTILSSLLDINSHKYWMRKINNFILYGAFQLYI